MPLPAASCGAGAVVAPVGIGHPALAAAAAAAAKGGARVPRSRSIGWPPLRGVSFFFGGRVRRRRLCRSAAAGSRRGSLVLRMPHGSMLPRRRPDHRCRFAALRGLRPARSATCRLRSSPHAKQNARTALPNYRSVMPGPWRRANRRGGRVGKDGGRDWTSANRPTKTNGGERRSSKLSLPRQQTAGKKATDRGKGILAPNAKAGHRARPLRHPFYRKHRVGVAWPQTSRHPFYPARRVGVAWPMPPRPTGFPTVRGTD